MIRLDSNILVFCIKALEPVTSRFLAANPHEVAIPSVAAYELEYGTLKSSGPRRRAILSEMLAKLDEIPFDREAAHETARIRIELERTGNTIGPLDLMIAGTALSRGAVLVTNNTKEFSRVKGLRLEDWTR